MGFSGQQEKFKGAQSPRKNSAYPIHCCSLELLFHHLHHHHYCSLMDERLFLALCQPDFHPILAQQSFAAQQDGDVLLHTDTQHLLNLPIENKMHTAIDNNCKITLTTSQPNH